MNTTPERPQCTQEAARLLPWFVNGTLSGADAQDVASHLEQCSICRADVADLGQVRALLRAPAQVEHAPHTGFNKLLARIDAAERIDALGPEPQPARPPAWRTGRGPVRWLSAAVVVQAAALAAIGIAVLIARPAVDATPHFRTLTTVAAEPAALRVVFAPATTLAEVQALLRANQLAVIAGPSDAGIFTLALRSPAAPQHERREALARLRADPRVRFAEPVGSDADAR